MKKAKTLGKIGFYAVLLLCVSAFGLSAYLMKNATQTVEENIIVNDWGEGLPTDFVPPQEEQTILSDAPLELEDQGGATSGADAPAEIVSGETEIAVNVFGKALVGEVTCAFSADELVENKTFGDWRTHSGVDIAAEIGDTVSVIADGTVSAVIDDPMMGKTVVVNHINGYASTYSNLESEVLCAVGDELKLGDAIGTVGNTAVAELLEPTHLHLELTLDQEQIDPLSVLEE